MRAFVEMQKFILSNGYANSPQCFNYLIDYNDERISVKKFRMKILKIIIDTINRYSKLRDFSLSFVLS